MVYTLCFFLFKNAVCFIILRYLVPALFTFYIQCVLKLKKKSGAKRILSGRVETESGGTRKRTGGEVKGKKANGGGSQQSCPVSDTLYPALLPLMRILRLLAAD